MGQFAFHLPDSWTFEKRTASTVHVVGIDGVPWPCRISKEGNLLTIDRNRDESGKVFVSFPFKKFGELAISTGSLVETSVPYCLVLELARGTVNRLRNQLSTWEEGGLKPDPAINRLVAKVVKLLGAAIMADPANDRDSLATEAIEIAMEAIYHLSRDFAKQVLPVRIKQINCPKYWMAVQANSKTIEKHKKEFDLADLVQVENASEIKSNMVNVILGPFLDASAGGMAPAIAEIDNFDERQASILRNCRESLKELPQSVKLLHAVSGLNGMGHRLLSYPQQLQITLEVLQTIENAGHQLPVMISFDTPWAERLAWSVGGVHPLQIADSLLRRGVTLSMLGLDINLDYWPGGCLPRDPFQWMELVDLWSQLGLPLAIRLTAPSQVKSVVASSNSRVTNSVRESILDDQCLELLETVIPMMLARPSVQGIIWSQFKDGSDQRFPYGGLISSEGKPKPVLDMLRKIFH